MNSFAETYKLNNGNYIDLLSAMAKLSGLFSDSNIPYINYRVVENIFCMCFNANNLSRSDTAFDAEINSIGIGLKTFICDKSYSNEKVAEFNSLSNEINKYRGKDLAIKLGEYRNNRIDLAKRLYNIESSLYHIVARKENELILFETDYDKIDINSISNVKESKSSIQFEDSLNSYTFNYSKSTLFRKFILPNNTKNIPIEIIENPYELILSLFKDKKIIHSKSKLDKGINYVVLPLYGYKKNNERYVFEKSGLNQWNASGRTRNPGEIYIPIPIEIHHKYPSFFPNRDTPFNLTIPTGQKFIASVCQGNRKALMTNPNKDISDWLLRKVLNLAEGELATIEKLDKLGFDSVIIYKVDDKNYKIDILKTNSYEKFIE